MGNNPRINWSHRAGVYLVLAVLVAVVAWWIPARWRSLHPDVARVAGQGTPQLVDVALLAAGQQRAELAGRLNEAATRLGLARTNEVTAALAGSKGWPPEVLVLGGPDPAVAALFPPLTNLPASDRQTSLEVFLPATHRAKLRSQLAGSRSPGVQALLQTLNLPTRQFVPANQPGGQPLEAVVLLTATLYERERLAPAFARELRELAEQAPNDPTAQAQLEEFYLNLLTLSRRLDWSSLGELTRKVPGVAAFEEFSAAVRAYPNDLPLLYAAALLSGDSAGVGHHLVTFGDAGREGLSLALRAGAGSVRWVARAKQPVRPGLGSPDGLARAVFQAPMAWVFGRTVLFLAASLLGAWSLGAFAQVGVPETDLAPAPPGSRLSLGVVAVLVGGFLVITSEPLPSRGRPLPAPNVYLDAGALTKAPGVASSSNLGRNIMEPTTLVTLVIFGAIQLVVYVICVRKIREITRLSEPPAIRLRLLENEENLFDSGLYVGIGGTALALMMQVLQLVEANLLAAYSSNLMGIICVAVVKIGHVRQARRRLILESQGSAEFNPPVSVAVPAVAPVPNPFTQR